MNETVTIKEGGLTRRLAPIDKLKINTTDSKDSTWVLAGKANTGVLHASENGIYIASEDGYEAYSEVIVRVTKDSFEGDTSFGDWDYETPDMDLSNWDPETIEDFELDPDGFDDVFNNEDEWKDIDKPIDIKMDNPKIQDTKISGIDPVTGNEMEVGLDEDGYLTESTLPSRIEIVQLPSKLTYRNGEKILFNLVVKAYTADGNIWTGESETGVIKTRNLTFPVTIAINEESSSEYTDGNGLNVLKLDFTYSYDYGVFTSIAVGSLAPGEWKMWVDGTLYLMTNKECTAYFTRYNGTLYAYGISGKNESRIGYVVKNEYGTKSAGYTGSSIYLGRWNSQYETGGKNVPCPESTVDPMGKSVDDLYPAGQTVPVQYIRSDGEVLETSFEITVLPDPDGSQADPSTVTWNHRQYKANEDLGAVEVRHGSVYMEGGAIYDVGAAVRLGMLEPVDNEIVP